MKKIIELLIKSFDSELNNRDKIDLSDALEHSKELQMEQCEYEIIRNRLFEIKTPSFSPVFEQNVIRKIRQLNDEGNIADQLFYWLVYGFRRLGLSAAVAAVILMVFNLGQAEQFSIAAAFGVSDMILEKIVIKVLFL